MGQSQEPICGYVNSHTKKKTNLLVCGSPSYGCFGKNVTSWSLSQSSLLGFETLQTFARGHAGRCINEEKIQEMGF